MKLSNVFLPFAQLLAYVFVWYLCVEAAKKCGLVKSK